MKKIKKILIITAGLGNGHNSAAKGMKEQYSENNSENNIKIIDITKITLMGKIMRFFFFNLSEKILETIFNNTNRENPTVGDKIFYKFFFRKISKSIKKNNPDILIFTFPCFPLCVPKTFKGKIIIQITDYISPHLSWIWGNFNELYVLDIESKKYLSQYIDKNKIYIKKFPLQKKIYKTISIDEKIQNKNTKNTKNKYIIVLFFHNILLGNEEEIIEKIIKKFPKSSLQILAGRNLNFFTSKYKNNKHINIFSWQENVDIFYEKADIVGGKCGGAFISEVIHRNLPIIITGVFSGQEKGNYEYLKKYYHQKIIDI